MVLKSGWSRRNHPNLKFLWYEDMKKDLVPVIRETAEFLGRHLTELKVLQLDDALYIDNFRSGKITSKCLNLHVTVPLLQKDGDVRTASQGRKGEVC